MEQAIVSKKDSTHTWESEIPGTFQFVSDLAKELSGGRVDLPSFPETVVRVQHVLRDEGVTNDRVARVVSAEAGLAARMLAMANSALLHRGGVQVTDLGLAIARIGHDQIRAAAWTYATAQLRQAPTYAAIRPELERLWQQSVQVAALSFTMAKESRRVRPDEGLLAGLLHNIGEVYMVARAAKLPSGTPKLDEAITRTWNPSIGRVLIENWNLPDEIACAVGGQLDSERSHRGTAIVQDVLAVAVAFAARTAANATDHAAMSRMPSAVALGLNEASFMRIQLESESELKMLQQALG
jgi:HD-like signal output (HDOD) protein